MIVSLPKAYPSLHGVPVIERIDTDIFVQTYFAHCMECGFCGDSCCQYGVDVDIENVKRIEAVADRLEAFVGSTRDQWFEEGYGDDPDFPGGLATRTKVVDGACVFLNRKGRGCLLHSFALQEGFNFNEIKPLVSAIFPVTFDSGCLCASDEIVTKELICQGAGPSLYEGARADLLHYFGAEMIAVLDNMLPHYKKAVT